MKCSACNIAIGNKRKSVLNCEHIFCFRCIESRYSCPLCKSVIETIENQTKTVVRSPNVVNYDFGKYWESKIVPRLDHPNVQRAIKECAETYMRNFDRVIEWDPRKPLASYSSNDGYHMLQMRREEIYLEEHPIEDIDSSYEDFSCGDYEDDEDSDERRFEARQAHVAHLHEWDNIKHRLDTYYLSGACHWFGPTVMLTLARMVEPDEDWIVRVSDDHTTVANRQLTRVFDLIYWGLDGRLRNYLFGDPIEIDDPSLGGKVALLNSE